jgi:hypothetical protein
VIQTFDATVRARLQKWPQRPPGLPRSRTGPDPWLRARPSDITTAASPFLKLPGCDRLRTLPDGLWLHFGGTPEDAFVDIFAVEACSSISNLLDKRSRFAPSTHSMLAICPVPWLLTPAMPGDRTPRWRSTGVLHFEPRLPLALPVRDIRVLYALRHHKYEDVASSLVPHAHEFFVPMEALTAEDCHQNPGLRDLIGRAAISANVMSLG